MAESSPVEHASAGLADAHDDIAESSMVAEPLECLAEGVAAVEEQGTETAIEGSQVLAEEGTSGFGDGQDAGPLAVAVADVVEQEAVQGASETVEEAAAAVFDDEAGISEPEQEALPRDIEQAAVQEEAPADVSSESMQLTRLLEQYGLEDAADVLASNGITKDRDLSFIDEDVIKDLTLTPVSKAKLRKLVKALGAPAPEETSVPVQEGGDKAPTEEGTAGPTPGAQDAIEESVEASDAMADAVPVADEDAGASVAESAPVELESAGLPDVQDDIAESTVVAEPLEPLAEGVAAVEEQEKDTAIEGSQVLAEEGTSGFGDGQDAGPLEEAVADVVEQEAVQGASKTMEEAAAAVVDDEAGISEPEQEALPRDIEQAAVQEEAPADVSSESMQLTRLLEQYGLEDEADVLASNGIKKDRDLSFIDEDVIKDLTLTPLSKAKLRKLVKALGAPAPEETSVPVQEGGDKAPTEVGTVAPTPGAQDAIEESVEASDAMADAVPVADEDAGASVAESAPVEHGSAFQAQTCQHRDIPGVSAGLRVQASVVYEELAKKLEKKLVKCENGCGSVGIEQGTQETHSGPEVHTHTYTHMHTRAHTHSTLFVYTVDRK
jgi:hypothetical protein